MLADAIWALHTPDLPGVTGHVQYVLDGGALVPWTRGSTYKDICKLYTEYVTRKFGRGGGLESHDLTRVGLELQI